MLVLILFLAGTLTTADPAGATEPAPELSPAAEPRPVETVGAPSDAAADAYITRCSGCHTVGGGALKGPDLLPSTQWPRGSLRGATEKMQKNTGTMTPELIDALTDLLLAPDLRARLDAARAAAAKALRAELDPPSAAIGRGLFDGTTALTAGGLACAACHRVSRIGGGLGPDLTNLSSRMDAVAMVSAFQGANFPIMRAAYADRAVSAQEAAHLAAYFETTAVEGEPAAGGTQWVAMAGIALGILGFLTFAVLLRPKTGTRRALLQNSTRS